MLSKTRFAFAASLLFTSSLAAKADMLEPVVEAPRSVFQFVEGVLAEAAQQNPIPAQVAEAPRPEAVARPEETLSPRVRSAMTKRDVYTAPRSPASCTNCY